MHLHEFFQVKTLHLLVELIADSEVEFSDELLEASNS